MIKALSLTLYIAVALCAQDSATPLARATANRAAAMSSAFEGNCAKTIEYEQMVIGYWTTQEQAQSANAFYQEGEMADEAARVCIDSGDLAAAAEWYRKGHDLGLKEPGISDERKALWDYRWHHAQARLAARHNNPAEAQKYLASARADLEKMTTLRTQQEAFLPYLTGYIAFYTGDYKTAVTDLQKAQPDPFILCLIGQTWEKLGDKDKAIENYRRAAASRARNPPAAYGVPFSKKRLAELTATPPA